MLDSFENHVKIKSNNIFKKYSYDIISVLAQFRHSLPYSKALNAIILNISGNMSCLQYKCRRLHCCGTCWCILKVNSKIVSGYKNNNIDMDRKLCDALCVCRYAMYVQGIY